GIALQLNINGLQVTASEFDRRINEQQQQMMMQMMMFNGGGASSRKAVVAERAEARVQLRVRDGKLSVIVNDSLLEEIPLKDVDPAHRAFSLDVVTAGMRGQNVMINGRRTRNDLATQPFVISDFVAENQTGSSIRQFIQQESREAALTIPRFRRDSPPTNILMAPNGDLLRGRLQSVSADEVVFESRLETFRFPRNRIAAILQLPRPKPADTATSAATSADDSARAGRPAASVAKEDTTESEEVAFGTSVEGASASTVEEDQTRPHDGLVQIQLQNGYALTMVPQQLQDGIMVGTSPRLGNCRIPAASIRELHMGSTKFTDIRHAYDLWIPVMAREPDWDIPSADGGAGENSKMLGTKAPEFELPMIDGSTFRLSEHENQIVVLDFWATWCG
ncbi:MAG: redoxin domain-containing protein, partial [Planctomycetaceae bacterium]|nr:redoxin domain-containing protein [Planctomycetaceae bacterium]